MHLHAGVPYPVLRVPTMTPARAGVAEGGGELCRAGRRLQADRSIAAAAGCSREGEAAGRAPEDKFVLKRNVFSSYFHCEYKTLYSQVRM